MSSQCGLVQMKLRRVVRFHKLVIMSLLQSSRFIFTSIYKENREKLLIGKWDVE